MRLIGEEAFATERDGTFDGALSSSSSLRIESAACAMADKSLSGKAYSGSGFTWVARRPLPRTTLLDSSPSSLLLRALCGVLRTW